MYTNSQKTCKFSIHLHKHILHEEFATIATNLNAIMSKHFEYELSTKTRCLGLATTSSISIELPMLCSNSKFPKDTKIKYIYRNGQRTITRRMMSILLQTNPRSSRVCVIMQTDPIRYTTIYTKFTLQILERLRLLITVNCLMVLCIQYLHKY